MQQGWKDVGKVFILAVVLDVIYQFIVERWLYPGETLITFGFSVYKFFQFDTKGTEQAERLITPRGFALMMITFGLVSLALGTVQHVVSRRQLRAQCPGMPRSVAALLAGLMSILGLVALLAVLLRQ